MIVWGSQGRFLELGRAGAYHCGACSNEQAFNLVCSYRVHHIWYLIRWIGRKDYQVQCPGCDAFYAAPQDEIDATARRSQFPWFDRFGWAVGAGVVVLLIGLASLGAADEAARQQDLLAHPQANDIYSINSARLTLRPERPFMYSLARVKSVAPDRVRVQLAKTYYEDARGMSQALNARLDQQPDYFAEEVVEVPREALQRLSAEGELHSVTRRY